MMNTTLQKILETRASEQAFRRDFSGPLALQLAHTLNIEEGNELVSVIGIGTEENNLEAIETWVFMVCSGLKLAFSNQHFGTLECMLMTVIDNTKPGLINRLKASN
ncbi:MAG: hypothetical protein ACQEQ2_05660 [Pseudomonadota bacterium]